MKNLQKEHGQYNLDHAIFLYQQTATTKDTPELLVFWEPLDEKMNRTSTSMDINKSTNSIDD